jgi:GNAT superfamily N-acetyltransferase
MHTFPANYHLVEMDGLGDPRLADWLCLYELTFPPEERLLAGELLRLLQNPAFCQIHHMLALLDGDQRLAGLGLWQSQPRLSSAYLWYLAIQPGLRSGGLGSALYQAIVRSALTQHHLLIFEVEMPEEAPDEASRQLRERRIGFYRRNGARMLTGVHYLETVGPHLPPVPMHLMAQANGPLAPAEVFTAGKGLFGDLLNQTGELSLI